LTELQGLPSSVPATAVITSPRVKVTAKSSCVVSGIAVDADDHGSSLVEIQDDVDSADMNSACDKVPFKVSRRATSNQTSGSYRVSLFAILPQQQGPFEGGGISARGSAGCATLAVPA
jgi:hypothetical protein